MIKVVLDTNVYLSALITQGNPLKIIKIAGSRDQKIKIIISAEILKEITRVIASRKFLWSEMRIKKALNYIVGLTNIVETKKTINVISDDPDNRILECAIEGDAGFIISGDKHLLNLGEYQGIKIIKPADFLYLVE